MDERTSFIAAIIAEPEEDVRRLAFADWLEDRGEQAQAVFIRGQMKGEVGFAQRFVSAQRIPNLPNESHSNNLTSHP